MHANRRHFALAGLAAAATLALSQTAEAAGPRRLDDASVGTAVEAFCVAMQQSDKTAFDKLCSSALSYGHSAGKLETKAEFIAAATNGKSSWKSIAFNGVTNQRAGRQAISRFTLVGQTESEGKTSDINIGVLMVWREERGAWKLLARQAFRLG